MSCLAVRRAETLSSRVCKISRSSLIASNRYLATMTVKNLPAISFTGDLNNTQAARAAVELQPDLSYLGATLAITSSEDAADIRQTYRPFLLDDETTRTDWIAKLELSTAMKMMEQELRKTGGDRPKVLVIFGSMRLRSELPRLPATSKLDLRTSPTLVCHVLT